MYIYIFKIIQSFLWMFILLLLRLLRFVTWKYIGCVIFV